MMITWIVGSRSSKYDPWKSSKSVYKPFTGKQKSVETFG